MLTCPSTSQTQKFLRVNDAHCFPLFTQAVVSSDAVSDLSSTAASGEGKQLWGGEGWVANGESCKAQAPSAQFPVSRSSSHRPVSAQLVYLVQLALDPPPAIEARREMVYQATATAPVNIAVIKYWGKRDTVLILPTNSSLSVTLDQDHLRSTTTSRADASFSGPDRLWLNGKEEVVKEGGRLAVCIRELRGWRREMESEDGGLAKLSAWPLRIASYNNFPTAAGLASSASGLAALVSSLSALYQLPQTPSELSRIARQGSGSACRSLFGGFVAWREGRLPDGSDSLAQEVAPASHWPEMQALICVVSDAKKGTSSTAGMQRTVATSPLLQARLAGVPARMKAMEAAIAARDFPAFAGLTMADSNQFHAVCLDTAPPIFYMNDVSRAIIAVVEELNRANGAPLAAYTFDAGPNAVIYSQARDMPVVIAAVRKFFPTEQAFTDPLNAGEAALPDGFDDAVVRHGGWEQGAVKALIHTRVGDGPRVLGEADSLLGDDGMPKVQA